MNEQETIDDWFKQFRRENPELRDEPVSLKQLIWWLAGREEVCSSDEEG